MRPFVLLATAALSALAQDAPRLTARFSQSEIPLIADPAAPHWRETKGVVLERTFTGDSADGRRTEVKAMWTRTHLYLLYVNTYKSLNLKPEPFVDRDTPRLWNWDVSEAFIGSDFENIKRYKEFQVSPQGEWVDLDIDRGAPDKQIGMAWNSGYEVAARIDSSRNRWIGAMKIPFSAIDTRKPAAGNELRLGLFRIEGVAPNRTYLSWQSTDGKTFHVPERFGLLRLER